MGRFVVEVVYTLVAAALVAGRMVAVVGVVLVDSQIETSELKFGVLEVELSLDLHTFESPIYTQDDKQCNLLLFT